MESGREKLYHLHGFHSRTFLNTYFSRNSEIGDDSVRQITEKFFSVFSPGEIKGDILIDLSIGPIIHHLYSACEHFRDIILLRLSDHCILELKRWLASRTGAFDWSHTSAFATELAGRSNYSLEEIQLRAAVSQVVKCDLSKENVTDPLVLPLADCLLCVGVLELVSKDSEDFMRNLKGISKLLKPSGCMVYYGPVNATYFKVGTDTFYLFKHDENYLRSAIDNEGLAVTHWEVLQKSAPSDLFDYDSMVFFIAYKQ